MLQSLDLLRSAKALSETLDNNIVETLMYKYKIQYLNDNNRWQNIEGLCEEGTIDKTQDFATINSAFNRLTSFFNFEDQKAKKTKCKLVFSFGDEVVEIEFLAGKFATKINTILNSIVTRLYKTKWKTTNAKKDKKELKSAIFGKLNFNELIVVIAKFENLSKYNTSLIGEMFTIEKDSNGEVLGLSATPKALEQFGKIDNLIEQKSE